MAISSTLQQKADEFRIAYTRSAEERELLASKFILESILNSLMGDVRAITKPNLDTLEQELRLVVNKFEELEFSRQHLAGGGMVVSLSAVSDAVSRAYNSIGSASKIRELDDDEITGDQWEDYLQRFRKCRKALREAIQQFLIQA